MIYAFFMCINIILFMFIWKVFWHNMCLAQCRDNLFQIRFQVRQYFLDNNISLDSEVYKISRDFINTHIQYAYRASLFRTYLVYKMTKNITITDPLVGLSILPLKHRQEVLKLVNKGAMEVVIYMLKKSFVAGVIIMLLSAIIPFLRLFLRKGEEVDAFKERTVNVAKDITSYAATATIS